MPSDGLPATGRRFEMRFCAMFVFEGEGLVCERVYFDAGTILRQLGVAHDPLTLRGRVATVVNHRSRLAGRSCASSPAGSPTSEYLADGFAV